MSIRAYRRRRIAVLLLSMFALAPFTHNCHRAVDHSALTSPGTPDSEDQSVVALENLADDGAPQDEPKVRVGAAVAAASGGSLKATASSLEAGSQLMVLVDNKCRDEQVRSLGSQKLALSPSSKIMEAAGSESIPSMRFQAVEWNLDQSLSFDELNALAESDPCIARVDKNQQYQFKLPEPVSVGSLSASEQEQLAALSGGEAGIQATANDPMLTNARHIAFSKALLGWDWFYSSAGVKSDVVVAVIDTGIFATHPDLIDNVWLNNGSNGYDFINNDNNPADDHGHGTHVAGIIGARANNNVGVTGVMGTNIKLMGVKVLAANGSGGDAGIANGIRFAADNGAHVINMSLGGPGQSTAVRDAMVYALSRKVTIIVAAGNENAEITTANFVMPAGYAKDYPGILAVASVDAVTGARSGFSNFSPTYVWIAAPGSNGIRSTYIAPDNYRDLQGTSMASPVVAGAAALVIGAFHAHGVAQPEPSAVTRLLTDSSRPVAGLVSVVRNGATLDIERLGRQFYSRYVMAGDGGSEVRP